MGSGHGRPLTIDEGNIPFHLADPDEVAGRQGPNSQGLSHQTAAPEPS
jgi:hypothetical protein